MSTETQPQQAAPKKTFHGSCHCGFIKYTVALALPDPPTATRCNCTVCLKQGFTSIRLPPADFHLLSPSSLSEVQDYQINPNRTDREVRKYFCGECGIHVCADGYFEAAADSEDGTGEKKKTRYDFFQINALTLEQPQEGLELREFKIQYTDGRNDNWYAGLKDVPWPGQCV